METNLPTASELVDEFRAGNLSPVEACRDAFDRIDRFESDLNAFVFHDRATALDLAHASERRWRSGEPLGPVDGVPTTVKDNLLMAGSPTRSGSLTVNPDQAWDVDAPGVARLRESGAVLIGKTTLPEFAWKVMTDSPGWGITRNPWDRDRTPGGSSGGAAAATAVGMGSLALATDGGGSIRVPASRCGLVGLKPTHGRVSDAPASRFGTMSHVGPIARNARDVALMMQVISRRDVRDWYGLADDGVDYVDELGRGVAGLRVGYSADLGSGMTVDPEVASLCRSAAESLADHGAIVEPIDIAHSVFAQGEAAYTVHRFVMQAAMIHHMPSSTRDLMDQELREMSEQNADRFDVYDFHEAEQQRRLFGSALNSLLDQYDILACPTIHTQTEHINDPTPEPMLTALFNASRHPAASVPAGLTNDGLPVGLQLIAGHYRDSVVLRAAACLDHLVQPPPIAQASHPNLHDTGAQTRSGEVLKSRPPARAGVRRRAPHNAVQSAGDAYP